MKPNQIKSMCVLIMDVKGGENIWLKSSKIIVMKRHFEATLIKAKRFLEPIDSMCLTEGAH